MSSARERAIAGGPKRHEPPSWCEVCSLPRRQTPEAWQEYQKLRLQHIRSLPTVDEVVAHETARRRWLGEPEDRIRINVQYDVDRWHTERRLDRMQPPAQPERVAEIRAGLAGAPVPIGDMGAEPA